MAPESAPPRSKLGTVAERARQAVHAAFSRHGAELAGAAKRWTGSDDLAQDAVQEIFLRYFVAILHEQQIRDERAWLFHVMRNLITDWRRESERHPLDSLGPDQQLPANDRRVSYDSEWMPAARRVLAPREMACVELRMQGLDYAEIAQRLQVRSGTVGAMLHKATLKLRQLFGVAPPVRTRKGDSYA